MKAKASKAVDYLLSCDILGVDTETRPAFKGTDARWLFCRWRQRTSVFVPLEPFGRFRSILRLLQTKPCRWLVYHGTTTLCLCTAGHRLSLATLLTYKTLSENRYRDLSLQKLYANLFHEKNQQTPASDQTGEADVLTDKQKTCAATDAWACIMLYKEICSLLPRKTPAGDREKNLNPLPISPFLQCQTNDYNIYEVPYVAGIRIIKT